ncbi:MAG: hypothetical protein IIA40_06190 [SAR324 cluster bacterium]|nr:hypothetical protein [SAR324 cluster bacterium]
MKGTTLVQAPHLSAQFFTDEGAMADAGKTTPPKDVDDEIMRDIEALVRDGYSADEETQAQEVPVDLEALARELEMSVDELKELRDANLS